VLEISDHINSYRSVLSSFKFCIILQLNKSAGTIQKYLLTPWCRVLLEKLTGLQIVKKFPAFHGTRMFITALTSVRHMSLSWASPIQSIYPNPTSWRSILILSTHLRLGLPSGSFPPVSPARPYTPPLLTHTRHRPSPSHSSRFYHPHNHHSKIGYEMWYKKIRKRSVTKINNYSYIILAFMSTTTTKKTMVGGGVNIKKFFIWK